MSLDWTLLRVELAASLWILVMLTADLIVPAKSRSWLWLLALAGVGICGGLLFGQNPTAATFQSMLVFDGFSLYFKSLFLLTAMAVIAMTQIFRKHMPSHLGAFYMLLFTALLGTFILSSMNDLLMLFLGLELLTFSLYVMAAYLKSDSRSIEAGMKYLIMGSISTGFLVYGIAMLYGFAGSTSFPAIHTALTQSAAVPLTAKAGLLLVIAGLGFKIAAVPFQFWVPDVYEGAPTPVVAFLSVGSKMAGVIAILRLLYGVCQPLSGLWTGVLAVLSGATILYGNLCAIPQNNIKRLLGYSSIGHAGYLLMGLSTGLAEGAQAVGFYLLAYLFSNLTVFLVVIAASDAIGGEALDDYKGLSKRSGVLAAAMFIGLLSLAGVPPLAGFVGKLLVLLATVHANRLWLVAIGAVSVAISLYYYLMVVKRMYLDAPPVNSPIIVSTTTKLLLAFFVLGMLAIGIVQAPFLQRLQLILP